MDLPRATEIDRERRGKDLIYKASVALKLINCSTWLLIQVFPATFNSSRRHKRSFLFPKKYKKELYHLRQAIDDRSRHYWMSFSDNFHVIAQIERSSSMAARAEQRLIIEKERERERQGKRESEREGDKALGGFRAQ